MILFDYGQTLVNEVKFDGVNGTEAVLAFATENKHNLTAEQIQEEANVINQGLGRFDPEKKDNGIHHQVNSPFSQKTFHGYQKMISWMREQSV